MNTVIVSTKSNVRTFENVVRVQYSHHHSEVAITQKIDDSKTYTVIKEVTFIISE